MLVCACLYAHAYVFTWVHTPVCARLCARMCVHAQVCACVPPRSSQEAMPDDPATLLQCTLATALPDGRNTMKTLPVLGFTDVPAGERPGERPSVPMAGTEGKPAHLGQVCLYPRDAPAAASGGILGHNTVLTPGNRLEEGGQHLSACCKDQVGP